MQIKKLLLPILATVMLICGCQQNNAVSGQDQLVTASEIRQPIRHGIFRNMQDHLMWS